MGFTFTSSSKPVTIAPHIAVYSQEKSGKSTFLAHAVKDSKEKGVMVLCGEDGLSELSIPDVQTIRDENGNQIVFGEKGKPEEWLHFTELLKWLVTEDHGYKVIAFDSLNHIVNGCMEAYIIDTMFEEKAGRSKEAQARAWGGSELIAHQGAYFKRILNAFKVLQKKGITVYSSYHSIPVKWNDPMFLEGYEIWAPMLPATKNNNLRQDLKAQCSYLMFGTKDITLTTNDQNKTKALGDGKRILYTEGTAAFDAVSRTKLPKTIEFSYEAFKKAVKQSKEATA